MGLYTNYVGLDIGKFNFVVGIYGKKATKEYENNGAGIRLFLSDYKELLPNSLCVLEATGGYESNLLNKLCTKGLPVHRANSRKVKSFIKSYGGYAKTDALDAKALARYGYERSDNLAQFELMKEEEMKLYELVQRRRDLKQMLVAEKNRYQAPRANEIKKSCKAVIDLLNKEAQEINDQIDKMIEKDVDLKTKKEVLKSIPGIGNTIADELLILMPELGQLTRREIASLAGLAPRANDSGSRMGYRHTGQGRSQIKPILFLAAMAARNSKSQLSVFYFNLLGRGKEKMVALVALMRKIIVIANAKLRDLARAGERSAPSKAL